ncbi:MAG: hypothetical protein M1828_002264 [Chrysothrix sp. TS-e1954]|nr:MAG: hypothetical protein M1828_002264 [Chrysothrix sp. TS-e1954]
MLWSRVILASKTAAIAVGSYALLIGLLTTPWLQRQAIYLHPFHTARWHSPAQPESFGFPKGQVTPFEIATSSNGSDVRDTLFAWHVLPFELYATHKDSLLEGEMTALDLLRQPDSRAMLSFHGNAGHLAQGYRRESLKVLSASTGPNTHIITFDYRGFGHSTGVPSEEGLICDGYSVAEYIRNVGQVPPARTVLLGHSLGTAVATGVYERYLEKGLNSGFAGLILVSAFTDIPNLLKTYLVGGFIPVLSPLKRLPRIQTWLTQALVDTWDTASRLRRIMDAGPLYLEILHAKNDPDIRWEHADMIFDSVIDGRTGFQWDAHETPDRDTKKLDGTWQREWRDAESSSVTRTVFEHGKHNSITTYLYLALVIRKVLAVD